MTVRRSANACVAESLYFEQPGIEIAGPEKFRMRAHGRNRSVLHDDDAIRQFQYGKSMRDNDDRPTADVFRQGLVDRLLAVNVDLIGRFIQ